MIQKAHSSQFFKVSKDEQVELLRLVYDGCYHMGSLGFRKNFEKGDKIRITCEKVEIISGIFTDEIPFFEFTLRVIVFIF